MKRFRHKCELPPKDSAGLPKLSPNASYFKTLSRFFRKITLVNPSNHKCQKWFRNTSSIMAERKRHATSRYYHVIHPMSTLCVIIEAVFFVVWTFFLISEPLRFFMLSPPAAFVSIRLHVMFPAQTILMLLFFNIGYVDIETRQIIIERKKVIRHYLTTYFIFDLIANHGFRLLLEELKKHQVFSPRSDMMVFSLVYVIRLCCTCIRMNTLLVFMENALANMKVSKFTRSALSYVVRTFLYIHLFTVFIFFVSYMNVVLFLDRTIPESSWLAQSQLLGRPMKYMYSECFLLTVCYFFGVEAKYDISVIAEEICTTVTAFFGRLYTLYLLADILTVFDIVGVSESMYERNLALLQQYTVMNNLPEGLKQRMMKYYEFKFQGRYFKEHVIVSSLSEHLRTELFLFSAKKMIEKSKFFKKLPSVTLGALIAAMTTETYSPRDIIVKIGSQTDDIFFISTGTVAVINKFGLELVHLEDGDEFGASCLLSKEQLYAIVAVETTEVFIINKDEFTRFLQPHPDVMSAFLYLVKKRYELFKELESYDHDAELDLLSELQNGLILEKRSRRMLVED